MLPLEPSQEKQKLQLKLVLTGNVDFKQTLLKNHNIFISFLAQTIAFCGKNRRRRHFLDSAGFVNWRNFGPRGGGYGNYRVDLPSVITRDPGLKVATLKSLLCQLPELWILFKHPIPFIQ